MGRGMGRGVMGGDTYCSQSSSAEKSESTKFANWVVSAKPAPMDDEGDMKRRSTAITSATLRPREPPSSRASLGDRPLKGRERGPDTTRATGSHLERARRRRVRASSSSRRRARSREESERTNSRCVESRPR